MPKFSIKCEQSLGMSHCGEVITEGESTVDLTDEEVKILVDLIREKDTTDVDDLELEEKHPELYRKLDEAYYDMAYRAEEMHWLWEGYYGGYYEYNEYELMEYCEKNLGFTFKFDPEKHLDEYELEEYDEDPESFEDRIDEIKNEAFNEWLDDYVNGLSDDEARRFFYDQMHAGLDMDHVDYVVDIPAAIIAMAKQQ